MTCPSNKRIHQLLHRYIDQSIDPLIRPFFYLFSLPSLHYSSLLGRRQTQLMFYVCLAKLIPVEYIIEHIKRIISTSYGKQLGNFHFGTTMSVFILN